MTQYRGGYIASCYAQALFSVSDVNSICKDVEFVISVLENDNNVAMFLSSPRVSKESKISLIKVIGDYIDSILFKFMIIVIESNRGNILLQILVLFLI